MEEALAVMDAVSGSIIRTRPSAPSRLPMWVGFGLGFLLYAA